MEVLLGPDFWLDQIAAALKAWAILLPLILIFVSAFSIRSAIAERKLRGLRVYTEAIESRLQLARDLNTGEANTLAKLRTEIDALRQLIDAKLKSRTRKKPSEVEATLKEVDTSAATLAMANSTTDHVLTAEKLSIGGLKENQKLRLVTRPIE
jgi:hypothetical protein